MKCVCDCLRDRERMKSEIDELIELIKSYDKRLNQLESNVNDIEQSMIIVLDSLEEKENAKE